MANEERGEPGARGGWVFLLSQMRWPPLCVEGEEDARTGRPYARTGYAVPMALRVCERPEA